MIEEEPGHFENGKWIPDLPVGYAGEDIKPGSLIVRGSDGRFYKARAFTCYENAD
jgi:hypothetical protein